MAKWLPVIRITRRKAVVVPLVAISLVAVMSVMAIVIDGGLLMVIFVLPRSCEAS